MAKKGFIDYILKQLDELKIEDIVVADTSKTSSIADYVIIGSGRSGKHIESSMEILKTNLKNNQSINGALSGTANDGWIILDLGNVIVHLFIQPVRDIYRLEELFNPKKASIPEKTKSVVKKKTDSSAKVSKKPVVKKASNVKKVVKKPVQKTAKTTKTKTTVKK